MRAVVFLLAFVSIVMESSVVAAQQPGAGAPTGLEAAVGVGWLGGVHIGDDRATLRGRGGDEFILFRSDSRFAPAASLEARIGYGLTRRLVVEARVAVARPELRASLTGDIEGAPPIVVAERLDRYTLDGALVVLIDRLRVGGITPFASAGAGYLRQLHEGRTLVENGLAVHAGGGARRQLFGRAGRLLSGGGVRADVRVFFVVRGLSDGGGPRPQAAISGSFFVTF